MNKQQQGFTLIEIAIVLVIIGLLLGGVLKGQELINTARVRALNNQVDGITAAWFGFSDRYRAFPGDYNQANVNLPGAPASGDGDGVLDVGEVGPMWQHLQAANYITGSFNGAAVVANEYACTLATCPDNGFGFGMVVQFGNLQQNFIVGNNAHELVTGRSIPSAVLAELDRKVDDGSPGSGSMRLGVAGINWLAAAVNLCQGGGPPAIYSIQTPSANCAAVFRNF